MAKMKKFFVCQNCGYESPKWMGKCPSCAEWNSMVEELDSSDARVAGLGIREGGQPENIADIGTEEEE